MQLIIECLRQRELNDTARGAAATGGRRTSTRSAAPPAHTAALSLRQLRHERLGAALFGAVRSESVVSRENAAVVYGVPSAPAVGRVIGFYNRTTMVFELDDRYEADDDAAALAASDEDAVAVGIPIHGIQPHPNHQGGERNGASPPSTPTPAGDDVVAMAPPASEDTDNAHRNDHHHHHHHHHHLL